MTGNGLPEWLLEMRATPPSPAEAPPGPKGGQVWWCTDMDGTAPVRAVVVTGLVPAGAVTAARIMLIDHEADLATDTDVIVEPGSENDLGEPVTIQSMLSGSVWTQQLVGFIGTIGDPPVEAALELSAGASIFEIEATVGLALQGRGDPRHTRRVEDADTLRRLVNECENQLGIGRPVTAADDVSDLFGLDDIEFAFELHELCQQARTGAVRLGIVTLLEIQTHIDRDRPGLDRGLISRAMQDLFNRSNHSATTPGPVLVGVGGGPTDGGREPILVAAQDALADGNRTGVVTVGRPVVDESLLAYSEDGTAHRLILEPRDRGENSA